MFRNLKSMDPNLMIAQPAYQPGAKRAVPQERQNHRPSNSIQKMVVLFTDVVGSSGYFKKYGDLAGREMLRKHQELASGPVTDYGGAVVKVVGDSVMAYFTDPEEALKAAVKIQERFFRNNESKDPKNEINVRIGLHYGDGIVDRGDIYGDVVNITAKFLPLVKGGEIFISEQLHDQVNGLSWARFEKLKLNTTKEILKTLVVFRVTWDGEADLYPAITTVVVLKPIWNLARDGFRKAWNRLLHQKAGLWPGAPGNYAELSDGSLVLHTKDPSTAPGIGRNALNYLRNDCGNDGVPFLPLQVVIDTGQFRRAGEPALGGLAESWAHARPGEITVSRAAFDAMTVPGDFRVIQPEEGRKPGFFRLLPKDPSEQADKCLFLYQHSMADGACGPCFYCGDRRHLPAECPSKQLPDVSHGLERLGYHSIEQINEIYFEYLNRGRDPAAHDPSEDLAGHAFFELKKVFQLRFLRTLWASKAETWSGVEAGKEEGEKGGLIWIGQDCIRVSNLVQAESVLVDALEKYPGDYLALCAMGFLQVENGDLPRAKRFFKQALDNTHALPRQIFTRFLLARIHELSGEQRHSEDQVRKILLAESLCQEALYLNVLSKFRKGNHTDGIRRLRRLIDTNRKYFIAALIDPELARYSHRIHPEINKILEKTADQADLLASQAAEEMEKMQQLLGGEDTELKRARSYCEKVQELSGTESYFGSLDIIYYATVIIRIARKSSENARRELTRAHGTLKKRHEKCVRFAENYPHEYFLGSLAQDLAVFGRQVNGIQEVIRNNMLEKFTESLNLARELAGIIDRMEQKVGRLESLKRWIRFGTEFGKKAFLMEGAVVLIALLIFPAMGHYLNFLIPGLMFSPENIWVYQKGLLILGGAAALLMAFLMSARNLGDT